MRPYLETEKDDGRENRVVEKNSSPWVRDRDKVLLGIMKDWLGVKDTGLGIQGNVSLQGRTVGFPQLPTRGCPREGDVMV